MTFSAYFSRSLERLTFSEEIEEANRIEGDGRFGEKEEEVKELQDKDRKETEENIQMAKKYEERQRELQKLLSIQNKKSNPEGGTNSPMHSGTASHPISLSGEDEDESEDEWEGQLREEKSWETGKINNPFSFLILDGDNVRKCLAYIMPWVLKFRTLRKKGFPDSLSYSFFSKRQRMLNNCGNT